jgi:hypothetical protein
VTPGLLAYTYVPFLKPLPVWDWWPVLLLPLTIAIAVVYKSVKCQKMSQVPREAAAIAFWILVGLGAGAVALVIAVRLSEMA